MMQLHTDLSSLQLEQPSAVALGMFDGLHLGHMAVLKAALALAAKQQLEPVVFTFANHPKALLNAAQAPASLCTQEEKLACFEALGFKHVVMPPFNEALRQQHAKTFFEQVLLKQLQMQAVSVGYNFAFGYQRQGTAAWLQAEGERLKLSVNILQENPAAATLALLPDACGLNSSSIRYLLSKQGKPELAAALLGRPYCFTGLRCAGQQLGRTIGFPTANLALAPENKQVLPKAGVYTVWAVCPDLASNAPFATEGVCNLGFRPTVSDEPTLNLEVHWLKPPPCDLPLNTPIHVYFGARLRDEARFPSLKALITQLTQDVARAASWHAQHTFPTSPPWHWTGTTLELITAHPANANLHSHRL
jgi:riboflavin kinase / FMN adenylyltransferase